MEREVNEMTREKKKRESNDGFGLTFKWITKGQSVSRVMQNERKCVEMDRSVIVSRLWIYCLTRHTRNYTLLAQ